MSPEAITEVRSLENYVGDTVTVLGWVHATRGHGNVGFVVVRDGTGSVQGVLVKKELEESVWAVLASLTQECTVALTGEVRAEPRAPGG